MGVGGTRGPAGRFGNRVHGNAVDVLHGEQVGGGQEPDPRLGIAFALGQCHSMPPTGRPLGGRFTEGTLYISVTEIYL